MSVAVHHNGEAAVSSSRCIGTLDFWRPPAYHPYDNKVKLCPRNGARAGCKRRARCLDPRFPEIHTKRIQIGCASDSSARPCVSSVDWVIASKVRQELDPLPSWGCPKSHWPDLHLEHPNVHLPVLRLPTVLVRCIRHERKNWQNGTDKGRRVQGVGHPLSSRPGSAPPHYRRSSRGTTARSSPSLQWSYLCQSGGEGCCGASCDFRLAGQARCPCR